MQFAGRFLAALWAHCLLINVSEIPQHGGRHDLGLIAPADPGEVRQSFL
jgi:hypothetical protein